MRYQEVYDLAKHGYTYQQIAEKMGKNIRTVYRYAHKYYEKTGVKVPCCGKKVKLKKLELVLLEKYGSKKEAAKKIGIGYTTLNRILAGKQKPHEFTIKLLMDATGLKRREILHNENRG